jgi:hypothetical protein
VPTQTIKDTKMKYFNKITILFFVLCCFSIKTVGNSRPIYGNFIQQWLYTHWSDEQWEQEFDYMQSVGIESIIVQDVANFNPYRNGGMWDVHYTSSLPNTYHASNDLEKIFQKASLHGIKLYIGMGFHPDWWNWNLSQAGDAQKYVDAMTKSSQFIEEVYGQFQPRYPDVFYGFYCVYEIWNHETWDQEPARNQYVNNLSSGFNLLINSLNTINPEMPLLFSPFSRTFPWCATKENTQLFYESFFTKTNFRSQDGMLPMDDVGGGGQTLETVEAWTKMYADALQNTGNKLHYYANIENFVEPPADKSWDTPGTPLYGINYWSSAPVGRFVKQLEIAQRYAEKIFCFSFSHYYSPVNNISGFYDAFINYLQTGEIDSEYPSSPSKVYFKKENVLNTATSQYANILKITYDGVSDNYGVMRVNLYKGTDLVAYRVAVRRDGFNQISEPPFIYYPEYSADATLYRLGVVDVWGNETVSIPFEIDLSSGSVELSEGTSCSFPVRSKEIQSPVCYVNRDKNVACLFETSYDEELYITLFSVTGVSLYSGKIKANKGINTFIFPVKSDIPGRFFVSLKPVKW